MCGYSHIILGSQAMGSFQKLLQSPNSSYLPPPPPSEALNPRAFLSRWPIASHPLLTMFRSRLIVLLPKPLAPLDSGPSV
jgi:hypothetical protein